MIMMTPYSSTATKGKKPYKSWLKDGVNGGPSSMDVLVNWLSKKANYAKWKGDDCERIPKKSLLESIIDEMREVGIYHRLAKDVASKISTLQSNYRLAREWKEVDGKKLLETGATEEAVHEELLKRFPYWDALDEVFNSTKSTAWPMAISSIMHSSEEDDLYIKQEDFNNEDEPYSPSKRRRKLSDNNTSDSASTTWSINSTSPKNSNNNNIPPVVIRPLPRVLPSPIIHHHHHHHQPPPPPSLPPTNTATTTTTTDINSSSSSPPPLLTYNDNNNRRDHILAESLLQITREKEAGRMKRSQDMLQFLREKRMERDQLLIEKELTKRVKAKAELVKNLMDAGFDKNAIAEQLNML